MNRDEKKMLKYLKRNNNACIINQEIAKSVLNMDWTDCELTVLSIWNNGYLVSSPYADSSLNSFNLEINKRGLLVLKDEGKRKIKEGIHHWSPTICTIVTTITLIWSLIK